MSKFFHGRGETFFLIFQGKSREIENESIFHFTKIRRPLDDLFTLFRENPFREGFNPFLDLSLLLAHVVDLIPFPETEGETIESHFESKKKIGMDTKVERDGRREREKERRRRQGHEVITLSTVFRAPSLCLFLSLRLSHCSVEVLALARFCMRRRSVDNLEREH